jgi:hemoglobin
VSAVTLSEFRNDIPIALEELVSATAKPEVYDPRAPGTPLGITDTMIAELVDEFYARVRRDAVLGPIFNAVIADWDQHLGRMRDFWSSVVLMSGRYKGKPVLVHARLAGITRAHFQRWLSLFGETANEICPEKAAALFIDRAKRIAASLELGMALDRVDASNCLPVPPAARQITNTAAITQRR